jgi:hypothetical protein
MIHNSKYHCLAIAGTFDRLHIGHEAFINHAFKIAERVVIGLTSDEFTKSKVRSQKSKIQIKSQKYQKRKGELEKFLKGKNFLKRCRIIQIEDVYGNADKDREIQALLVTVDSKNGGELVNERRVKLGLQPLVLENFDLVLAEDRQKISSTRIRLGEIDRVGRVFAGHDVFGTKVGESLRLALKSPLGMVIQGIPENYIANAQDVKVILSKIKPVMVISVGDITTKLCNLSSIKTAINIVDFLVNRIPTHSKMSDVGFHTKYDEKMHQDIIYVPNPAGHMTREIVEAVKSALAKYNQTGRKVIIKVDGEEDLAGVPAILLAPLGSVVLYGQPGEGIVVVEVTEEKKSEIIEIIEDNI